MITLYVITNRDYCKAASEYDTIFMSAAAGSGGKMMKKNATPDPVEAAADATGAGWPDAGGSGLVGQDGALARPAAIEMLPQVARQTVQDQVFEELRRCLIHGVFDAGEVLRIRDLAASMSVSTMPVREALGRLIAEHALELMPNRSVRVPLISRDRLDDLARARALIEGELAVTAMANLGKDDIAALEADTARYDALTEGRIRTAGEAARLNHAFHFRIYRAAKSPVLIPIVESLWMQSGPYVRAAARVFDPRAGGSPTNHHRSLIIALKAGDAEAVRASLVADINRAFELIRGRLDEKGSEIADG